jgi:hypothetical protein
MKARNYTNMAILVALLIFTAAGCGRDTGGLKPATAPTDPIVFDDDFGSTIDFQAFLNTKLDAVSMVTNEKYLGTTSLKITVPGPDDPSGWFAGGAFTAGAARDLSGYNALTFWAKANKSATLNIAGLGNDNTGTSKYEASLENIPLTTTWTKVIIPIPLSDKLTLEKGLFFFAEGYEGGMGYEMWFDEIMFEEIGTITNPRPVMESQSINTFIGATVNPSGTRTVFDVDGTDQTIGHLPGYFTFISSDETVAAIVDEAIRVVGGGNATITALLDTVPVDGEINLNAISAPTTAAPTPTVPAGDVKSLFSNVYTDVEMASWLADWSVEASVADFEIAGDDVKVYTYSSSGWAGIVWGAESARTIDATGMTHFHMDVWVPEGTTLFKVKLVDFGPDGVYTNGNIPYDISQRELSFSDPPLATGVWVGLEIDLEDFMWGPEGLVSREHLAQLVLSGTGTTAFVDNIYFHK